MSGPNPRLQFIAAVADIPAGGLGFTYVSGPFPAGGILVRTASGIRGWRNQCRHLAVPLDHDDPGTYATGDRLHLVCGKHGALYRPDDGVCVAGPCRGAQLRSLPIVLDGEAVYLDLDAVPEPLAGLGRDP